MSSVLITGGAGFVGSNLAVGLAARHPDWRVIALDNLHRSGSELNLERLAEAGVEFVRGDVREPADLAGLPPIDALIECSAEPSVMSGVDGDTSYLYATNLTGAYNCLELARRESCQFIFLSSSRVYPLAGLRAAVLDEAACRFELAAEQPQPGLSASGVGETMPLPGARTLYGTTKLSAELLIAEYAEQFPVRTVINRCGVIAGPWQMGKVDQGVFTHWILAHLLGRPLSYIGYGGTGKQVRDLLHVLDLVDLVELQLLDPDHWHGRTFNAGGGREVSLSLLETTSICARLTGNEVPVAKEPEERSGDVGAVVTDYPRLKFAINRLANWFIRVIFRLGYNDTTNAFKGYRREVIETMSPLLSKHFNLTVEMPLKAITRGHSFKVVPTSWTNRTSGEAKLAMREMGSRYLFIVLYIWLEHHLSRGDYRRPVEEET